MLQCLGNAFRSQRQRCTQENSWILRTRETSGCQVRKPRLSWHKPMSSFAGSGNTYPRFAHPGSMKSPSNSTGTQTRWHSPLSKPRHALARSSRRRLPRWGTSSVRLTSKILAHHELRADPQTLASIVSVVGSGSGLLQGEDRVALHDRYMDCYAERCCQWGAQGERAVVIGHRAEAHDPVHTAGDYTAKPLNCVVCNTLVHGRRLQCHRCGHGGHSKHVAAWFEFEAECRHEACECLCWKNSLWEHAG